MSIPLDRLYHYIESVAQEVYGDTLIYRFWPHGSKNINDLAYFRTYPLTNTYIDPQIFCNDQEPLNYDLYQSFDPAALGRRPEILELLNTVKVDPSTYNLRITAGGPFNIYDKCLLLHSEQRSEHVELYQNSQYFPVYYWCHAILAHDWFRYAQYQLQRKIKTTHPFLIYNRAWSGTREYRLKFADLLIDSNLTNQCLMSVKFVDDVYYQNYKFINSSWKPKNQLEQYYKENVATSCYSADFVLNDYETTDFEVVLETLFDDQRLHLTEKALRPIACGQPFILAATHGSLSYLRNYGFRTFSDIIDENYDIIRDPVKRLHAVVNCMKDIANWSVKERKEKLAIAQKIANYNQKHFFSNNFFNQVTTELSTNLQSALDTLRSTNTSKRFIDLRKMLGNSTFMRNHITNANETDIATQKKLRADLVHIISTARKYYNRYLTQTSINI